MASTAVSKPPSGVSTTTMWNELKRKERKEEKAKEEARRFSSKVTTAGVGAIVAVASGLLMARFPRLESFDKGGKVKTAPILGFVAFVGAIMSDKGMSDGLEGTAYALTFPFLAKWGGKLNAQIPG